MLFGLATLDYNEGQNGVSNPAGPMETTETMEIVVNGELRSVPSGLNVLQLLIALDIDPARVAVELNRTIARKSEWESTVVGPGATLEVVQFVGGG